MKPVESPVSVDRARQQPVLELESSMEEHRGMVAAESAREAVLPPEVGVEMLKLQAQFSAALLRYLSQNNLLNLGRKSF